MSQKIEQWEHAFNEWPGWRGNDPIRQAFQAGWDAALASHTSSEVCPSCGSPDKDFRRCSNPQHAKLGNVHPLVRFECERCINGWHEP